jgi:hypothetical protein
MNPLASAARTVALASEGFEGNGYVTIGFVDLSAGAGGAREPVQN